MGFLARRQPDDLRIVSEEARRCILCAPQLEHPPRPVFRLHPKSRILIIGQAPGAKVHESGVPWQDASGDHLREWLGIDMEQFSHPELFGILPMGLCWPGRRAGGDLPPRPECAPLWHKEILAVMTQPKLTLLVGRYAAQFYLSLKSSTSLQSVITRFDEFLPERCVLPHPSWRSKNWMTKNPWFASELLPLLQKRVREIIAD